MLDFSGWQWWDGNKNLRPIRSIDVYVYFINPPWRIKKCMPYFYVLPFTITQMLHGAGIFTNIYPKNHPNVGKYFIHGASGSTKTPVMLASMDTIHGFYGYYGMAINHNGPIDLKGRVAGGQFDKSSLVLAEKNKYKKHFKRPDQIPKIKHREHGTPPIEIMYLPYPNDTAIGILPHVSNKPMQIHRMFLLTNILSWISHVFCMAISLFSIIKSS